MVWSRVWEVSDFNVIEKNLNLDSRTTSYNVSKSHLEEIIGHLNIEVTNCFMMMILCKNITEG